MSNGFVNSLLVTTLVLASIAAPVKATNPAHELSRNDRTYTINEQTNVFFYSLHPEMSGKTIKPHQTLYKREWRAINQIVKNHVVCSSECGCGLATSASNENLTNAVFYARHLELNGRQIRSGETFLINEWKTIYQKISMAWRYGC